MVFLQCMTYSGDIVTSVDLSIYVSVYVGIDRCKISGKHARICFFPFSRKTAVKKYMLQWKSNPIARDKVI